MTRRTLVSIFVIVVLFSLSMQVVAQEPLDNARDTIVVSGRGVATGTPDIATVRVIVEASDPDVSLAYTDANTRLATLVGVFVQLGVAGEDIRTSHFSIDYVDYSQGAPPFFAGGASEDEEFIPYYSVRSNLNLTVRNVDTVGQIVQTAIENGATSVNSINFSVEDTSALRADALTAAMADARATAERLAAAEGVQVGDVLFIGEGRADSYPDVYASFGGASTDAAVIAPGQFSVSADVRVIYAIAR